MSVKYSARVDILEISSADRGGGWGGGVLEGVGGGGCRVCPKVRVGCICRGAGQVVSVWGKSRSYLSRGSTYIYGGIGRVTQYATSIISDKCHKRHCRF